MYLKSGVNPPIVHIFQSETDKRPPCAIELLVCFRFTSVAREKNFRSCSVCGYISLLPSYNYGFGCVFDNVVKSKAITSFGVREKWPQSSLDRSGGHRKAGP